MAGWIPQWAEAIGAMLDSRCCIVAACTKCGVHRDVDLAKLIAAKGRSYSLVNRRCPCRITPGCKGWNRFHYSASESTPLRPLWVEREVYPRWYDMMGAEGRPSG